MVEKDRIHFGSLEETQRKEGKAAAIEEESLAKDGMTLDQLNPLAEIETKNELKKVFEQRQLKKTLQVPTDDQKVRNKLRELYEPMTLFGEDKVDRRERLKEIMAIRMMEGLDVSFSSSSEDEDEKQTKEEYTYGVPELTEARRDMLQFSIEKAKARLRSHREELAVPFADRKKLRHEFYTGLNEFQTKSLQFGDERPIGFCRFSPNSKLLATASWSGLVKLWNVSDSENVKTLRGHKDRVSCVDFHPHSTVSQDPESVNMASGSVDGGVHLWSLKKDTPIATLDGHDMRVARLAFHPSGKYVGTASFDTTWRLWDIATQQELLLQEGHSREVFAIGFQGDGALCATAGLDSVGRVWDLRMGRSIMVLRSHIKPILAIDWSPNGYQLATGGEDNTIRIWDIRAAKCIYTIPAHKSTVTQIRFWRSNDGFETKKYNDWTFDNPDINMDAPDGEPAIADGIDAVGSAIRKAVLDGSFIVSSSYDGSCKLWSDGDYKPLKSLSGLEGRVMCADISGDGQHIATSMYDRTFKIYGKDSV